MLNFRVGWIVACLAGLTAGGVVRADPPAPSSEKPAQTPVSTPQTDPYNPGLWNAERMMEEAVQTLARRYNLNPEQEAYTRQLLVTRTRAFLSKHEPELRQLIKESIELRIGRIQPTPENYKSWAERARPIYEAAKKEILDGNREWGEILDPQQQQTHRMDLDLMAMNFQQIDGLIGKWSEGKFETADLAPRPPAQTTLQPPEEQRALVSQDPPIVQRKPEDFWEMFVRRVIATYRFTNEQKNAAYAILQECRNRAKGYRDSHKGEYEAVEARLRDAIGKGATSPAYKDARKAMDELEKPILDIFADLRERLDQIPTQPQREGVTEAQRRSLDAFAKFQSASTDAASPQAEKPDDAETAPAVPKKPMTRRATRRPADARAPAATQPTTQPASAPPPKVGGRSSR